MNEETEAEELPKTLVRWHPGRAHGMSLCFPPSPELCLLKQTAQIYSGSISLFLKHYYWKQELLAADLGLESVAEEFFTSQRWRVKRGVDCLSELGLEELELKVIVLITLATLTWRCQFASAETLGIDSSLSLSSQFLKYSLQFK